MPPREYSRTRRVAEQIQRELAELITREVNDPRVGAATLSGVEVSRDLANATVYVTPQAGSDGEQTVSALNKASGFLRHGLARRATTRTIPRLRFVYDATLDNANRIESLLSAAEPGDSDSPPGSDSDPK